mgnify:FL=1
MAQIISVSIDLNKLDKSRIVEGKNGAKYYNFTINVNDEKDNYGNDASVTISQTAEERQAKVQRTFVGNGRVVWSNNSNRNTTPQNSDNSQSTPNGYLENDLPF